MLGLASLRLVAGEGLMQRLRCLVRKEFLELRMNPRLFGLVIIAPILQLTMLGYAATTDVKNVPLLVADGDRSAASRELIARFDGVAELHRRRYGDDRQRDRAVPRARHGVAGAVDSGRLRREHRRRSSGEGAGRRRRHRLELDDGRARLRDEPDWRLRAGPRAESAAGATVVPTAGRAARRRESTRGSASGSTRSSRAATS